MTSKSSKPSKPASKQWKPRSNVPLSSQDDLFAPSHGRPWTPHALQLAGTKFLIEHDEAGLIADPGVGKTSMTLAAIKILIKTRKRSKFGRALLVAPKNPLLLTWPNEVAEWTDFHGIRLEILHGDNFESGLRREADIYGVTRNGLFKLAGATKVLDPVTKKMKIHVDLKAFQKLGFDTLIVDELTGFKHHNSDRFRLMQMLTSMFLRRWGLTGDPAPNGLGDLWGQMYVLDQGRALGRYITHFRREFMSQDANGVNWGLLGKDESDEKATPLEKRIRREVEQTIYTRIAPLCFRIDDSHLAIPKLLEANREVEMPPKAMKAYKEVERDLITQIEKNLIVAANAAAATSKCLQIATGAVYTESPDWTEVHDEKLDDLEQLMEDLQGKQLAVCYWWKHSLERLQNLFAGRRTLGIPGDVPFIGGGTKTKELRAIERDWNIGRTRVIFLQPGAAALGLNLQKRSPRHLAWFDLPNWDYEKFNQTIRRLRRQGNKTSHITNHYILARGTLDFLQLSMLRRKGATQGRLLSALKAYAAKNRRTA